MDLQTKKKLFDMYAERCKVTEALRWASHQQVCSDLLHTVSLSILYVTVSLILNFIPGRSGDSTSLVHGMV